MLGLVKNYLARVNGGLHLSKGIIFLGDKGTGKTLMIECLRRSIDELWGRVLTIFNATYITKNYYSKESHDHYSLSYQLHFYKFIAINDLGMDREFASGSNIVQEILFDRFEKRLFTFGSTNLNKTELFAKYDDDKSRMADRYEQMFNYITLTGDSFRQQKTIKL